MAPFREEWAGNALALVGSPGCRGGTRAGMKRAGSAWLLCEQGHAKGQGVALSAPGAWKLLTAPHVLHFVLQVPPEPPPYVSGHYYDALVRPARACSTQPMQFSAPAGAGGWGEAAAAARQQLSLSMGWWEARLEVKALTGPWEKRERSQQARRASRLPRHGDPPGAEYVPHTCPNGPQVRSSLEEMVAEYVAAMKKAIVDYVITCVAAGQFVVGGCRLSVGEQGPAGGQGCAGQGQQTARLTHLPNRLTTQPTGTHTTGAPWSVRA